MTLEAWPFDLNYLAEIGTYGLEPHDDLTRTEFDYGPAAQRRRFVNSYPKVTFSISMTSLEFETFKAFYHYDLLDGMRWFTMPVYFGSTESVVKTRFTKKYTVSNAVFDRISVGLSVETKELPVFEPYVLYLIKTYGMAGIIYMSDHLDKVVNTDYPYATRDY